MNIKTFQCNFLQENCYVVSDETCEAAVIDCGAYYDAERKAIASYLEEQQLKLRYVLCTHAHFDHIFGLDMLYDTFDVKPRLHAADEYIYHGMSQQVEAMMGMPYTQPMPPLDIFLTDGYQLPLGNHRIDVMHTPGHSPGSVVFYVADEHCLFAGDTLFRMSVGRTDLEGGSWTAMMKSLQRIATTLSKDTVVYCGHGPSTTLADELRMNPYFK